MFPEIVIAALTLFAFAYFYMKSKWNYWTKKGIYQIEPTFPFGTFPEFFTKSQSFFDSFTAQGKVMRI